MYGRSPIEDLDLIMPSPSYLRLLQTAPEYFENLTTQLTQAHHLARENMQLATERQRLQYRRSAKKFEKDDKVWLFTPILSDRKLPKLVTGWSGPWTIIEAINDLMYVIQFTDPNHDTVRTETVSIDRLRKHYPDAYGDDTLLPPPGPLHMAGDEFATHFSPKRTTNSRSRVTDTPTLSGSHHTPPPVFSHDDLHSETHSQTGFPLLNEPGVLNPQNTYSDAIANWVLDEDPIDPNSTHSNLDYEPEENSPNTQDDDSLKVNVPMNVPLMTDNLTSAAKLPKTKKPTFEEVYAKYKPSLSGQTARQNRYLQRQQAKEHVEQNVLDDKSTKDSDQVLTEEATAASTSRNTNDPDET